MKLMGDMHQQGLKTGRTLSQVEENCIGLVDRQAQLESTCESVFSER